MDDSGIGGAARVGLEVYEQASRGSGRTYRMVMGLPDGVHVMYRGPNDNWLIKMIRDARGPDFKFSVIRCTRRDEVMVAFHEARRLRKPVALDHQVISMLYERALDDVRRDLEEMDVASHEFCQATSDRAVPPCATFRGPL